MSRDGGIDVVIIIIATTLEYSTPFQIYCHLYCVPFETVKLPLELVFLSTNGSCKYFTQVYKHIRIDLQAVYSIRGLSSMFKRVLIKTFSYIFIIYPCNVLFGLCEVYVEFLYVVNFICYRSLGSPKTKEELVFWYSRRLVNLLEE